MKKRLIFFVFCCICSYKAGTQYIDSVFLYEKPRQKKDYDKPGQYEMITQLNKTEINPGDSLNIYIKFSGYGEIGQSKVFFANANHIIDVNYSYITHSILIRGRTMGWGGQRSNLNNIYSFTLTLMGVQSPGWQQSTMFIDDNRQTENLGIITESIDNSWPIVLHLKTIDSVEPGTYKIAIVFTYFNGEVWQGQPAEVEFKVDNWAERHSTAITVIGLIIAFVSITPFLVEQSEKIIGYFKKSSE